MRLFIFLFLIISSAYGTVDLTEDNIEGFFQDNPEIKSLRERLEASQKLKGSLTRSFLPKVLLSYGREKYSTGPYDQVNQPFGGIEAKINVFNSGKDSIENERRSLDANVSAIDSTVVKGEVLAEIRKSMAQFAYLDELTEILKSSLENNNTNMKAAQRLVSAGLSTETDTLDFKQQDITLNQEMASLEFEKGVVKRLILTLIGKNPEEDLKVSFINKHPEHGKEESLNVSGRQSLIVQRSLTLTDIAKLELKQAERWWAPSVDIYGYAMRFTQKEREYPKPDERNDTTIGFRIILPIFDGGEGIRQGQAKAALAKSQESLARAKQLDIEKSTIDAKKKLELAHHLIHGAEENVEVMTKYRRGILAEYGRGIKNSPDVLQASQRWIQSKVQFAEIKKNYQFARAEALYLIGLSN